MTKTDRQVGGFSARFMTGSLGYRPYMSNIAPALQPLTARYLRSHGSNVCGSVFRS